MLRVRSKTKDRLTAVTSSHRMFWWLHPTGLISSSHHSPTKPAWKEETSALHGYSGTPVSSHPVAPHLEFYHGSLPMARWEKGVHGKSSHGVSTENPVKGFRGQPGSSLRTFHPHSIGQARSAVAYQLRVGRVMQFSCVPKREGNGVGEAIARSLPQMGTE